MLFPSLNPRKGDLLFLWSQSKPRLEASYASLAFIPVPVWVEKLIRGLVLENWLGGKALPPHRLGPGLSPSTSETSSC